MARWAELLRQVVRLDVADLAHKFTSPVFNTPAHIQAKTGGTERFAPLRWFTRFSVRQLRSNDGARVVGDAGPVEVLAFAGSTNQARSLEPLVESFHALWVIDGIATIQGHPKSAVPFPCRQADLIGLAFLPLAMIRWVQVGGVGGPRYLRRSLPRLVQAYGAYLVWRRVLESCQPRCVVLANDHNLYNRALIAAARDASVPSVYTQHASVTDYFPPLAFDFALLEGRDAADKYARRGNSSTEIFLVGMTKADECASTFNSADVVARVGICTNTIDPPDRVREVCEALRRAIPRATLILRPHPATPEDVRTSYLSLCQRLELEFSDARVQSPFVFLQHVDAIVSGDSNIHLEAALVNVYPIYFDFSGRALDHYGFVARGLLDERMESTSTLVEKLRCLENRKPDVRLRAHWYCDTVGTPYDGRSCELAAGVLRSIVERRELPDEAWETIECHGARVRRPRVPLVEVSNE